MANFRRLRKFLLWVIALLVISEATRQVADFVDEVGGVLGGLFVAAVYVICGWKARAGVGYHFWILVPTLLFTVIPLVIRVVEFFTAEEKSWLRRLWEHAPFIISFVIPVGLILWVYVQLGRHLKDEPEAGATDRQGPTSARAVP